MLMNSKSLMTKINVKKKFSKLKMIMARKIRRKAKVVKNLEQRPQRIRVN